MKMTWNLLICRDEGDPRTAPDICESSLVGVRFIRWKLGLPRWRDGQWVLPTVKGGPLMVRSAASDPEKSRGVSGILQRDR